MVRSDSVRMGEDEEGVFLQEKTLPQARIARGFNALGYTFHPLDRGRALFYKTRPSRDAGFYALSCHMPG